MAMVLQANRVSSSDSSTVAMDSYKQLQQSPDQDDTFHRKILEKIEEGKRDRDPERCQQIINDLMTMLKHLTADVNNYNLAFRETRPPFYMQEFQRLTDRIETLTKARDILTEYLRELEDSNQGTTPSHSSSFNDISSVSNQFQQQLQYSPTMSHSSRSSQPEHPHHQYTSSTSSIHSSSREILTSDHSTNNDHQRSRSPTLTPSHFIRVHFPNKHTTALAPRSDETLETALESRASRHSVTNLRACTPFYMISRQPCPWGITLNRLRETEIELVEKTRLDHSFIRKRFFTFTYCDICHKILLQGLRCLVCGSRIHIRCIHKSHTCHTIQQTFSRYFLDENIPPSSLLVIFGVPCAVCHHRIRGAHKRCVSCKNNYHNHCYPKVPVCAHPIMIYIQNIPADRSERASSHPHPQSRSLPRIPISRPSINTNHGIDPEKDIRQNSLFQPPSTTILSSSLPSSAAPIHQMPQLLRPVISPLLTSPEIRRPSLIKPNSGIPKVTPVNTVQSKSDWEIPPDDLLNHGRMVGRGTYGTVYKADVRLHGNVALKELNFISPTPTQFQAFRNEVIALKKITHQNTLNFYGYILSPRFAIVTQWCEGSTLYKHIHILDRHWKINQLIDIARQICQGMSYLHYLQIIHRDLKSSNVFLDMCAEPDDPGVSWRVKIGDFGLATVKAVVAEGVNQQLQPTGSVLWMAPEVIQQKDQNCYSFSSDVYAYGCVLFEMFSGKLPHAPINNKEQIMWLVGKGRLKIKVDQCRDDTPESIVELIRLCTEFDREQRPDFAPDIDDTLSKFEFIFPRIQRSQSEPCLIRNPQEDLLGLSISFGVPKTPLSIHRRFNAEVS